jgi:hypothetical protein
MIANHYNQYIKYLFVKGFSKPNAKKNFIAKWKKENMDVVWKEEKLAGKTFEVEWAKHEKNPPQSDPRLIKPE